MALPKKWKKSKYQSLYEESPNAENPNARKLSYLVKILMIVMSGRKYCLLYGIRNIREC